MGDRLRIACVRLTSRGDAAGELDPAARPGARAAGAGGRRAARPRRWTARGGAGLVQECARRSGRDKAANLETAARLVAQAAATGADLVALPEKWNAIGDADLLHESAETIENGESVKAMRAWARGHGVTLVGGSITERREGREKLS